MKGKMCSFRLKNETTNQLTEISKLWGVSRTMALEIMINTFANTSLEMAVKNNEAEVL